MPQFVVLEHDHPVLHWDFMLEQGEMLKTWRFAAVPDKVAPMVVEALPDHRHAYLDYEGPVSRNRGAVHQWDRGDYECQEWTDTTIRIELRGQRLAGHVVLRRLETSERWEVMFLNG